jgi:perosamine synthetase
MTKKIYYAKPSITELEVSYVTDAIKNGWGDYCYDYIYRLQESFQDYLHVKYSLPTSSCTGALHLAFAALDIGLGDEVICPDITWIASVAPITYLGAKPVFIDVLSDSWCIDPKKIEAAITDKTKAILAVHLYGNLAEMDEILRIAKKHNLPVVEDAAEALGSEYREKKAGTMGDVGVFSFHGTKTMTTGEGGMLVTNNTELFEKLKVLSDHGRNPDCKKMFWNERIGYKYKMSNLQAALGCAQIERLGELVEKKRQIFSWYQECFKNVSGISWNLEPNHTKNSYWMPTLLFNEKLKIDRDNVIEKLIAKNIQARPFFYPLSSLPMFEEKKENEVSYSLCKRGINLPSYYEVNKRDMLFISSIFEKIFC